MLVCTLNSTNDQLRVNLDTYLKAYIPGSYGHYVENIGNTTLHYLEIFKTDTFQDVSLRQVRPTRP